MAILGSIADLTGPVTGKVNSADVGNFLAENPIMNLGKPVRLIDGPYLRGHAADLQRHVAIWTGQTCWRTAWLTSSPDSLG